MTTMINEVIYAAYGIVCADIDIDSKADDYDGGEGDDKSFQVQQQRTYLSSAS